MKGEAAAAGSGKNAMLGQDLEAVRDILTDSVKPTTQTMGEKVAKALENLPEAQEALKGIDYMNPERFHVYPIYHKDVSDYEEVVVFINTGGSEGIYVDAYLLCHKGSATAKEHFLTVKTLGTAFADYAAMGALAGLVTILAEDYLWINDALIDRTEASA